MYTDTPDKILFTPERAESLLTENGGMKRAAINVLLGLPEGTKGQIPPWRHKLTGTFIDRKRFVRAMEINHPAQLFAMA